MESATVHSSEVHEVDFRIPPSPFSQKKLFRKPTFNSLFDPFGSPSRGQKPSLPLKKEFFLPLRLSCKESSTFLTKPLFPQGREDVTALRCSEPLRSKVGGPSKVCAKLCGLGPPGVGGDSDGGYSAVLRPCVAVQLVPCYRCNRYQGFM